MHQNVHNQTQWASAWLTVHVAHTDLPPGRKRTKQRDIEGKTLKGHVMSVCLSGFGWLLCTNIPHNLISSTGWK